MVNVKGEQKFEWCHLSVNFTSDKEHRIIIKATKTSTKQNDEADIAIDDIFVVNKITKSGTGKNEVVYYYDYLVI